MKLFREESLQPQIIYEVDDEVAIGGLVSTNFGIAIAANTAFLRQFDHSLIPLDVNQMTRIVYLTYNRTRFHTNAIQHFVDFMVSSQLKL